MPMLLVIILVLINFYVLVIKGIPETEPIVLLFVHLAVKMEAPVLGLISVHVPMASREPNVKLILMNVRDQNFKNVPQIPFVSINQAGITVNANLGTKHIKIPH